MIILLAEPPITASTNGQPITLKIFKFPLNRSSISRLKNSKKVCCHARYRTYSNIFMNPIHESQYGLSCVTQVFHEIGATLRKGGELGPPFAFIG